MNETAAASWFQALEDAVYSVGLVGAFVGDSPSEVALFGKHLEGDSD